MAKATGESLPNPSLAARKEESHEQTNRFALNRDCGWAADLRVGRRGGCGDDVRSAALSRPGRYVVAKHYPARNQNHSAELATVQELHAAVAAGFVSWGLPLAYWFRPRIHNYRRTHQQFSAAQEICGGYREVSWPGEPGKTFG